MRHDGVEALPTTPSEVDGRRVDSFLVAAANTPWVYALARSLAQRGNPADAVTLHDWLTYRRVRPRWPEDAFPEHLLCESWVFPPGYMGAAEPLLRPVLRHRWQRALRRLAGKSADPWVVCPYPWLVESFRGLASGRMIYFNLDDYRLYRPERTELTLRQEDELVNRSALVFCLAQIQVESFRSRYPDRAERMRHLPLAAPDGFLNPTPGRPIRERTVGYIGNLVDRVDWRLVKAVARRLPDVEFVFIGYSNVSGGGGRRPDWREDRDEALRLPNVRQVAAVAQDRVPEHYWSFALSWIPYAVDHEFNTASCPTKIMDGLASGRPVLSTDIPECRLYCEWIEIFHTPEEAADVISRQLARLDTPPALDAGRRQVEFVSRFHTWERRAELVEEWLSCL